MEELDRRILELEGRWFRHGGVKV